MYTMRCSTGYWTTNVRDKQLSYIRYALHFREEYASRASVRIILPDIGAVSTGPERALLTDIHCTHYVYVSRNFQSTHFPGIFSTHFPGIVATRSFVGASRFSTDAVVSLFRHRRRHRRCQVQRKKGGREHALASSPVPLTMRGFWFGRDGGRYFREVLFF